MRALRSELGDWNELAESTVYAIESFGNENCNRFNGHATMSMQRHEIPRRFLVKWSQKTTGDPKIR